ncbi:MAG: pyridoxal-phosphate dependent enzyme [Deltaproteobacteria bacterium]|nr:pyridoxal-phosphate dependent enzyme [Deltaproteobacteria bacterium]
MMRSSDLALFRAWPGLRSRIPRCAFIEGTTPVEPLELEGLPKGRVFIKRDDLCCSLYGGNKPRKLEFVLARALTRSAQRLVTTGAHGSHHALATTVLGRSVGLSTSLVLVPQPAAPEVDAMLAQDARFGAEIVYARGVADAGLKTAVVLVRSLIRGEHPYLLRTGGSSAVGNLGFVSAALELVEQIKAGELDTPDEIYVPIGTGGTLVGLVLGFALARIRVRVHGVLVTDILSPSPRRLLRMARSTFALLHRAAPSIQPPPIDAGHFIVDRSELGRGYGYPTRAALAARAAADDVWIPLETTYTAKCLAALQREARAGKHGCGPILFWNTHSSVNPKLDRLAA